MKRLQNYIDRVFAHYVHIFHGSNIPIIGGIGVNEKIAKPIDSFKLEPPKNSREERIVQVFQYEPPPYRLSYSLEEMVPNKIILQMKKAHSNHIDFIGATASIKGWRYSLIENSAYSHWLDKVVEKIRLKEFNSREYRIDSPFGILTSLDSFQTYLLIDKNINPKGAIEQFLAKYHEANRKKLGENQNGK